MWITNVIYKTFKFGDEALKIYIYIQNKLKLKFQMPRINNLKIDGDFFLHFKTNFIALAYFLIFIYNQTG